MPNPAVESPRTKRSGSKGGHHHSLGHGSNTSTPKCPNSTSAKKPSSSKEPALKEQDKSPKSCSSHKCSHSPSLFAESAGCKWKEARTEDTRELNSTLPISSSVFDGFCSPTGSHSEATELHPPSITLTPLGLGTPRQWQSTSEESRHSLASLYTSPGFNLPGHPVAGPSNLTPSIPSLAGSLHVSSTWPTGLLASGPSSPHLTIDQANSLYKLATECQALGVKLAKKFQVFSGLEAMHRNSIQGTAHETLTLRCSAQEATYSAIMWDRVPDDEREATTRCLCSEADVTWKEMHEVMYSHQLHYDRQLATFLWMPKQPWMTCKAKCGMPSMPWQRMRALCSMPTWVSCCKCSTCSSRFPQTFLFTEGGAQSRVVFALSARKSGHPALCPKS